MQLLMWAEAASWYERFTNSIICSRVLMVFNEVKTSKWSSINIFDCPSFLFALGSRSLGIWSGWQRCFGSPLIATWVDFSKESYAREQALICKLISYFSNINPSRLSAELIVYACGIPQTRYVFSRRIGDGSLDWRVSRTSKRRQAKVNSEVKIAVITAVTKTATNKSCPRRNFGFEKCFWTRL